MNKDLAGLHIAIIGGDRRELVLMEELARLKAEVLVTGYDMLTQLPKGLGHWDMKEALTRADTLILPMPGTDEEGRIKAIFAETPLVLTPVDLALVKSGTLVLVGIASNYLKSQTQKLGLKLIETAELDEMAIFNSIPTAEGAIEIAMRETSITLHGSHLLIFGFGRIGMTLARMLRGLGAQVAVVARKVADLARAEEQGYSAFTYETVMETLKQIDMVFNTVPHLVLTEAYLRQLRPDTLVIDLASAPGGTDFDAASRLGIKAILALGLPGKVAPKTAGEILGRIYPKLILQQLGHGETEEVTR